MNQVLVTGAAGFIGSHVAERLLKRGDTVIGLDEVNNYYPVDYKRANLTRLSTYPNFSCEEFSLEDLPALKKLFSKQDISHVAHLAARAGVRPSIEDPFIYQQANVAGTLNLLEVARLSKVANFVLTSSSSVYGNSTQVPFREDDSATDLAISPYAATKKATEVLGHTFHHLYGLNINVVRPFTVYGPCGRPDMAPWLFTVAALQGKKIKKFGDGSSRRDYTFIEDFVDGFVNAIDRELGYEIFNLGNSQTVSLNEAIDTISEVTGRPLLFEQLPMQPGDVMMTNADISKAQKLLDYNPQTSFKAGMKIFCDWLVKAHPELVEDEISKNVA
ncbi:MAG: GDP-mannose 4,6-dehydratase [Bdellovibrionales bacterium]|nr:GDP-mannose 4,6-dehydratase [Bdellovibrionales bacterium]